MALHVFNDHNGIVHHQSGGQGDAEQRQGIDREAEQLGEDESSDQRNRNGDRGNNSAAPALEEKKDHHDHDQDGLGQRLQHLLDRFAHGARGIEGHLVLQAHGKAPGQLFHGGLDVAAHLQGVGVGELQHAQAHGVLAVIAKLSAVAFGAQFGAAHIAQLNQRTTVFRALHHDMVELLGIAQTAHGAHADLVVLAGRRGLLPHLARRHLDVLLAQGAAHVAGGEVARGQLHRVQPEPHGIFALAENDHVAHALHPLQRVAHVQVKIVADEELVVLAFIGIKTVRHHERAGVLGDADAGGLHFGGQAPQRAGSAVLHVHRRHIQVAVQVKGGADGAGPVIAAGRAHVAHALSPVDGLLQQRGHAGLHRLRVCAGIKGAHADGGRRQVGILRHRQGRNGNRPGQHNQQRTYRGKYRPAYEKVNHEESCIQLLGCWLLALGY